MKKSKGINFKIIGKNIRTIREFKGLTQEELGELVHCSTGHIKNTESGTTGISLDLLIDLAEYYVAAEPPVRCGESHPSGQTEPPCY